jgi:protoheme ferro-lyase
LPSYLNVSIALIVFMALASGGMLTLVLMAPRRQQTSFTIMLALALLIAVLGVYISVTTSPNRVAGLTNAVVLLVLSFALGYTLTTFSVLSSSKRRRAPAIPETKGNHTAVILYAPGEPPEYDVRSAARRFELADDAQDIPPILLRPFYMRDLRTKYSALGISPYRDFYLQLAEKVQSRLDTSHRVEVAFYSDQPSLASVVSRAMEEGAKRIVITHLRASDPPDPVRAGDLFEGLNPESKGVKVVHVGPLTHPTLLPQIYVRRVLESVPQVVVDPADLGLLLVGRGHDTGGESARTRQEQEVDFQRKVREALVKVGFDESRITQGWLRAVPTVVDALAVLIAVGCKVVLWMPSTYPADGINTLFEIPTVIEGMAREHGVRLVPLGAWNADDLAAEEIASLIRANVSVPAGRT